MKIFKKAAKASPLCSGGSSLATSKPSCKAITAPATPSRRAVLCTISIGVQLRFSGWPKIWPRSG
jgi:hypothetical protein